MAVINPVLEIDKCIADLKYCTVKSVIQPIDKLHTDASFFHSYYNHHAEAFEIVEATLKSVHDTINYSLTECSECVNKLI